MSLQLIAKQMEAKGRNGDSVLVHMTTGEVAGLQQLAESAGGSLTVNPETGLVEASFLKSVLPTLIGAGLMASGVGMPLAIAGGALAGGLQARQDDGDFLTGALMGGLGAYGGAGLAGSLGAAGTAAGTGMGAGAAGTNNAVAANLTPTTIPSPAVGFTRDMMVGTPPSAVAPQMSASALPQADLATQYGLNSGTAAPATMSESFANAGRGLENLQTQQGRDAAYDYLGGGKGVMKTGLAALAPALSAPVEEQESPYPLMSMELNKAPSQNLSAYEGAMPSYNYQGSNVYIPTFRAAEGGLAELAKGGMREGGFVVPADVVSMVGEGNTDAGYRRIMEALPGSSPIKGEDGGQADTVETNIEGKQPAAVAHGEMYVPPEAVQKAGGAKKLYAMMDRVREQATGSKQQIKPVRLESAMA